MTSLLRTRTEKDRLTRAALQLGCGAEEAKHLLKHARYRRFAAGDRLASLGAVGREMHIIISGTAHMSTADGDTATLGHGDVVGELYAYRVSHFQIANVACDREVETITIPLDRLERVKAHCPTIMARIEAARDERGAVVTAKREAESLRRWEQYQQIKPYIS